MQPVFEDIRSVDPGVRRSTGDRAHDALRTASAADRCAAPRARLQASAALSAPATVTAAPSPALPTPAQHLALRARRRQALRAPHRAAATNPKETDRGNS